MTVGTTYQMITNAAFLARIDAIKNNHVEYALIDNREGWGGVVGYARLHVEDFALRFEEVEK